MKKNPKLQRYLLLKLILSCAIGALTGLLFGTEIARGVGMYDPVSGSWTFGVNGAASVWRGDDDRWRVRVFDSEQALPVGHFVHTVAFNSTGDVCVLHLLELDLNSGGIWHANLLVFNRRGLQGHQPTKVFRTLGMEFLDNLGGLHFRIVQLGSIEDFPRVDLFVSSQKAAGISLVSYDWQEWNLESQERLGVLDRNVAERRLSRDRENQLIFPKSRTGR